jgi:GNAT superfamily N-acetyltransferase
VALPTGIVACDAPHVTLASRHERRASPDGYTIDTDPGRLDRHAIHAFLVGAYWCHGIPREVIDRSIEHSLCFGLYAPDGSQAGFARVVTDRATFAWVGDVFVLPAHRGRGLGVWLMEVIAAHPELQGLRRWMLGTRDAHELYRKTGYVPLAATGTVDRYMVRPSQASYGPGAPAADPPRPGTDRPDHDGGQ